MNSPAERQKTINRAGGTGIAANLALALAKALAGLASGSVSVMADAANNAADSVSSLVTMVFYSISKRRPSRKHPLGYGRMEHLSALLVSVLVVMTGFECLSSSIRSFSSGGRAVFTPASVAVIVISLFVKAALWKYSVKAGRKVGSEALVASGKDALSDALVSCVTLCSALLTPHTTLPVDSVAGCLVAAFIIWTGVSSIWETTSSIMGERPGRATVEMIRLIISRHPPLKGGYDIMIHSYGPERVLATCNVEVPTDTHAEDIFDAMTDATKEINERLGIVMTFGLFAVNDYRPDVQEMKKTTLETLRGAEPHVLSIHAFHVHFDRQLVHFDVVVDFTVRNYVEFTQKATRALEERMPGYSFEFTVDPEYD